MPPHFTASRRPHYGLLTAANRTARRASLRVIAAQPGEYGLAPMRGRLGERPLARLLFVPGATLRPVLANRATKLRESDRTDVM